VLGDRRGKPVRKTSMTPEKSTMGGGGGGHRVRKTMKTSLKKPRGGSLRELKT